MWCPVQPVEASPDGEVFETDVPYPSVALGERGAAGSILRS